MKWAAAVVITAGLLVIVLLAVIPSFIRARTNGGGSCIANLRTLEGAKHTWFLEERKSTNDIPTDSVLFGFDKYVKQKPICPAGGTYTLGAVNEKPRCSVADHTL